MKRSFLILVSYENKLIANPYFVIEEDEQKGMELVVRDLFSKGIGKPDIELQVFDVEKDCVYLGEPDDEDIERISEEIAGEGGGGGCSCPMKEECDHFACGSCTFEGWREEGDVVHNDPPEDDDERIYQPNELVFAIADEPEIGSVTKFIVHMMVREDWEKYVETGEPAETPDLGCWNVDNAALAAGGLGLGELMESIFEVHRGRSRQDVIVNMIDAGFGYLESYQKKIDSKEGW